MALTDLQKAKLVQILGKNIIEINLQLASYADDITAEMETEIGDLITDWVALDGTFSIEPKDRNFGVSYAPGSGRAEIATNIGRLLFFEDHDLPSSTSVAVYRA